MRCPGRAVALTPAEGDARRGVSRRVDVFGLAEKWVNGSVHGIRKWRAERDSCRTTNVTLSLPLYSLRSAHSAPSAAPSAALSPPPVTLSLSLSTPPSTSPSPRVTPMRRLSPHTLLPQCDSPLPPPPASPISIHPAHTPNRASTHLLKADERLVVLVHLK